MNKENKLDINLNFLIYDNRSGSTYLSALLNSLDDVGVTLESPILLKLIKGKNIYKTNREISSVLKMIYEDDFFKDWGLNETLLKERLIQNLPLKKAELIFLITRTYFDQVKPNAKYLIYKNGDLFLIKELKEYFPNAKLIFIYRDGRAVFCSKKKTFSKRFGKYFETDPIRAAKIWSRYINVISIVKRNSPVIMVKYEYLIQEPKKELKRIYKYLSGKEYEIEDLRLDPNSYFNKIPESQAHLHTNVGKKPMLSRIEGWKDEITLLECYYFEKYAYNALIKLGYEIRSYKKIKNNEIKKQLYKYRMKLFFSELHHKKSRIWFNLSNPLLTWHKLKGRLEIKFSKGIFNTTAK